MQIRVNGSPISNDQNSKIQAWKAALEEHIPKGNTLNPPYRVEIELILDPDDHLDTKQYPWAGDLDNYLRPILNALKCKRATDQKTVTEQRPLLDDNPVIELLLRKRMKFNGEKAGAVIKITELG